jgi:death-on-curing protein
VAGRWIPTLEDYIELAAYLLGTDRDAIAHLPRISLAESAVHAPFASFAGEDAYPTLVEQAAVLIEHLARNHPLPDGNKRAAFLLTARFLHANGRSWGAQDVERDASMSSGSPLERRRPERSQDGSPNAPLNESGTFLRWARRVPNLRPLACEASGRSARGAPKSLQTGWNSRLARSSIGLNVGRYRLV